MVELSRSIANKIKDKQGDITEDEVSRKQDYLRAPGSMFNNTMRLYCIV